MTRSKAMMNRLLVTAPWVTVAALVALSLALPNRADIGTRGIERKAEIAAALRAIPHFIGRWTGPDESQALAPSAQKLLKPNGFFSRRYFSPSGEWVHLVIVHCGDARDMIGHYPPICYPSAGWTELPAPANPDRVLTVNQTPLAVREYRFRGYLQDGREDDIRIFNAFVLPDGTVTREIDDVNRQSERLSVAIEGVAQMQIITAASVPVEQAMSASEEILGGISDLFRALQVEPAASAAAPQPVGTMEGAAP